LIAFISPILGVCIDYTLFRVICETHLFVYFIFVKQNYATITNVKFLGLIL